MRGSPQWRVGAGLSPVLVAAMAAVAIVRAQDAGQAPAFRAGINFVRVDVSVSDSRTNDPVLNLGPADFEIREDGRLQTVESFKLVTLDGGAAEARGRAPRPIRNAMDEEIEAARDDVRLFAIFLDDSSIDYQSGVRIRQPLARFVESALGPSDMVGVMYPLQVVSSIRWTRNRAAVVEAVRTFGVRQDNTAAASDLRTWNGFIRPDAVRVSRQQLTLAAIKALVTHMGSLKEGRKTLILVSGGFRYSQLRPRGAGTIDERGAALSGISAMQADMREIWDAANKNNVSIYPIDPRGLAAPAINIERASSEGLSRRPAFGSETTLRVLAEQTDGRAIVGRNAVAAGLTQIVRDMSAYYLLGYRSTDIQSDGAFHTLSVRVRQPGVDVRARKGYWAITTEDAARMAAGPAPAPSRAVETALAGIDQPLDARAVRTWIGLARGENGRTRITIVWEPKPRRPDEPGDPRPPAALRLVAAGFAPRGVPLFSRDLPASAPGVASETSVDVAPGRLRLRLSVEGASSAMLDTETRVVEVPDFFVSGIALGTPRVLRARTFVEYRQIKADPDAPPVATREFHRTDRVIVRVPAYGPGPEAPSLTVRMLSGSGRIMATLRAQPSASMDEQDVDLPVASLAPGDYVVEIAAAGEPETAQVVAFRIAP